MPKGIYPHKPHTEEWKNQNSLRMKGKRHSLGYKHTDEWKIKNSKLHKGCKRSEEARKNMSIGIARKGRQHVPPQSKETRRKRSESMKGKNTGKKYLYRKSPPPFSKEHIAKMVKTKTGKPNLSCRGEKSHFWKGGVTPVNKLIRRSIEYTLWRKSIFERDNFTCQHCKQSGGFLHPQHVLNFAEHENLRFAIDNGITLCESCHLYFHKSFGWKNNTREQLLEFLKE